MRNTTASLVSAVVAALLATACGDKSSEEEAAAATSPVTTEDCSAVCDALFAGGCISSQASCSEDCMASWRSCAGWQEAVDCFAEQPAYSCTDPTPPICREKLNAVRGCAEDLVGPPK
ncbi:MAG: hypothetical protein BWY17_05213 [Deltaproteobacteria bacterium ADurb.Bin207]|jgi:hypothetical protein|nr:MAG: hypothetical protein BWY17_05213 [Deltaproteobacteria bacterium ADurb.Bin207]